MRRIALILMSCALLGACSQRSTEERGREALEKIKESIPDIEARALEQKVSAEDVKQAQQALKVLNEYLGDATGTLDSVTVNAIEAFQRSSGLEADGMLTEKTQRLLKEAAARASAAQS